MKQLLRTVNMGRSWCHIIGGTPAVQNTYVVSLNIFCFVFESVYVYIHMSECLFIVFFQSVILISVSWTFLFVARIRH